MSLERTEVFRLAVGGEAPPLPEEAALKISARQRFAAALAVYLLWVAALIVLAATSAARPAPAQAPGGAATASSGTVGHTDGNREGAP
jgi:hypothetical protein